MNKGAQYQLFIKVLKNMDENQLSELFYDLDDFAQVELIGYAADKFVENYLLKVEETHGKSEYQEAKEIDDSNRYREIKSDNKRPY